MVEMSPELVVMIMFGGVVASILLGFPISISLGGIAMVIGYVNLGPMVFHLFQDRVLSIITNYVLLAAPMFIFMGVMVEKSGITEKLYGGLHLWFGGIRGGLAISTILVGTILAACVGIIGASVITIGLIAIPSMLQRGYNKELTMGSVCAGGCLGILIPPSVMLVFYGPMAQLSVGKLFMGAFIPGFTLSALYIIYILILGWLRPTVAPAISIEERAVPILKKIRVLMVSMVPPIFLIIAVLGSIFFGVAAPTEAAAVGALASVLLVIFYRQFNWNLLKEASLSTFRVVGMAFMIGAGATMFTSIFLRLGGGEVISNLVLSAPGGRWGSFAVIMLVIIILGMFIDWIGIIFIMIPLVTPIGAELGFDPIWFALMICINLQMSFMTPPFAFAIFYVKGILKPEWGIETSHIIRGVIPFIILIMVGLILCAVFPELILWLPAQMIK
jgi:tripartite ATP-independent transporter DctM subunit